jgi:hypothetical protein
MFSLTFMGSCRRRAKQLLCVFGDTLGAACLINWGAKEKVVSFVPIRRGMVLKIWTRVCVRVAPRLNSTPAHNSSFIGENQLLKIRSASDLFAFYSHALLTNGRFMARDALPCLEIYVQLAEEEGSPNQKGCSAMHQYYVSWLKSSFRSTVEDKYLRLLLTNLTWIAFSL